ncbi:hypothetical protein DOTSEDRAFT_73715 [Dothistroma septosporum NZE10]|uniref:F-box domain-containing protein n=1 Tax=Dothistroma septosporum (strain NZE10 / CBS 128990) TaxID=675120 RepID=N1PG85_DOTSN|nr:hypothetical protein DOTSEDRAFT_73715 [Dothistroma septosporum NZE10]
MEEVQNLAETYNEVDRLPLLRQLVDGLTPKERHALTLLIDIKNDRLAALPVELVIQILSHLSLLRTWTLRRVSRRWQDLLSSGQIVDAALKRWDTHNPEYRVKSPRTSGTSEDIFRRVQSWRLGRPFSRCSRHISIGNSNGEQTLQATRTYALSGHYFAYIGTSSAEDGAVIVFNLLKGSRTRYRGAARENMMCLSLTNSIIAYCSFNGKLYTSRHDHTQLGSIQLPSAGITAFCADQDTVGVVLQGGGCTFITVILYDCTRRTTRHFAIDRLQVASETNISCPITVLQIDVVAETVDVFGQEQIRTDTSAQSWNSYVEHRRYSFAGNYLGSSSWKRLGTRARSPGQMDRFNLTDLHHAGVQGLYVFRTPVLQSADQVAPLRVGQCPLQMLLCFDSGKARVVEHVFPSNYQQYVDSSYGRGSRADRVCPMLWKGVEIRADPGMYFSTMSETDGYRIRNSLELKSRGYDRPSQVLVNESFSIATCWVSQAQEWHANIFCFEDGLDWKVPGAEVTPTYFWDATTSTDMKHDGF